MTDTENTKTADHSPADEGIGNAIKALIEDGQTLLEAEVAYRKAQAAYGLGEAKVIGLLLLLGLAFAFFTLLALVVGLLLAVATLVGVWGALAIVGGALALLSIVCLWLAASRIGRAKSELGKSSTGSRS
ncbi:MAG: hypothetical protein B7Y36_03770 [Novosphingobium sp. 28-62-57]|uniref:phage holin family protein n=1 Tax=unclassified Novosphingobium TaxID=2644732 RepID=UPI000BC86734|nr:MULTISPECIES: phage holin family protein [unclassified Novosphingobium]OYW48894.1 MAG: hypothetical protein B7Z34_10910 [Novosphingobium sp. 12-62-10]OYZ12623.1 MAG: hypothetical protein B7Y36_03770 [Novosphingobium sp. 28-62-57]OZA31518.1 MAG: hypothetical protein B7X92_14260 [Novosphingobium sp. 17-62-9]